jgi:5-methyltetrahydrofolate--homocysteine methyltransferase
LQSTIEEGIEMNHLEHIRNAVIEGDEEGIGKLIESAVKEKLGPRQILEEAMIPAMEDRGEAFSRGEVFIPDLLVASAAMEAGMAVLEPYLTGEKEKGLVVLGTVEGDIHSIGKNLVRICLEGCGFEVMDIGENVKAEKFLEIYRQRRPDILGLSALLSSTMQTMRDIIEAIRREYPKALIMIGGAPVNQRFADEIGASGYAPNAFEAVNKARELIG